MTAAGRDAAADARAAAASAAGVGSLAQHHVLAAADRSAAVADREDLAAHDAAALARDAAAARRDESAATRVAAGDPSSDWAAAAADRVEAAADRGAAAARNVAARVRDDTAQARDVARAGIVEGYQTQAAADRQSSAEDRTAAASERHDAADTLARAYRDELTGALMRDPGLDQLGHAVDRAHRGEPLVLAFVDVDHLKWFNDTQGHAAGDHVLEEVGRALAQGLRSYDVVVRYGGDEFVCALHGLQLAEAEQRFAAVASTLAQSGAAASVTVGFAELTPQETLEQVLARADDDMYARRRRDSP